MFFKPAFFEAALGVNLTTMLVLTTIIINVRQILPTTSYLKMFDIWLIICQLIPFIEVCIEALSSGEPKPIISNVARGQLWAEAHHF